MTLLRLWQLEDEMRREVRPAVQTIALLQQSFTEFRKQQEADNAEVKDSVKALRSTLIAFAFTVAGSAVVFAFAAFAVFK